MFVKDAIAPSRWDTEHTSQCPLPCTSTPLPCASTAAAAAALLHLLRVVSIVQTCSTILVEFYYAN